MHGHVMTVLGPLAAENLGLTLTHEHLLVDTSAWGHEPLEDDARAQYHAPVALSNIGNIRREPFQNRDNCVLDDPQLAIEEVRKFKEAGGQSLVDCSNIGLGRHPQALRAIADATQVNIIMGCGYYIGRSHPDDMHERPVEAITEEIVRDLTVGVGDTGIRAGIIGEIGTSYKVRTTERKVLEAAARAQRQTGAPISVHLLPWRKNGLEVLDILEAAGADVTHVILCHLSPSADDVGYHTSIVHRGAYVEYDFFGMEFYINSAGRYMGSDMASIAGLKQLVDKGCLERLLLSHDTAMKIQLTRYGGWGYGHLPKNIVPLMRHQGFTEEHMTTMMVDNPRRVLTWASHAPRCSPS
ncbi:Phosphotriesterase homology protein [Candidatus Entotheonellaceae bacterium PAL068K]